jgi:hypothetical protein
MMTLLIQREWAPSAMDPSLAASLEPSETWMRIYLPGRQHAGYLYLKQDPEDRSGVSVMTTQVRLEADLVLLGRMSRIDLSGQSWSTIDGKTSQFDFTLRSEDHEFRIDGQLAKGTLDGRIHTAGEVIPIAFPVGNEFSFSATGLPNAFTFPTLEVGEEYTFASFDPLTMSADNAQVHALRVEDIMIDGALMQATVLSVKANALTSTVWVDENNAILRADTAFGFSLERTTAAAALERPHGSVSEDMISVAAVQPTGKTPFRGAKRMRIQVSGLDEGVYAGTDDTQEQRGTNEYLITQPVAPESDSKPVAARETFLKATPLVQSDHPLIRDAAAIIVGPEEDPWRRAQKIHDWVFNSIDKLAVVSVPSALDVLETREGDCNEHTVLYTALARAADLPTRIAIGLVWSEEYDGFYYHAWPEVFVDDRWYWIDPTLGQPVADASHIKLFSGGIERWGELVPFLMKLRIDVMEIE